jgi:hypothetical protein
LKLLFLLQITLFDSADLAGAIAYSRLLKLTLFVNGQMVAGKNVVRGANSSSNVVSGNVKQELREIRDRINHLLDSIEDQVYSFEVSFITFLSIAYLTHRINICMPTQFQAAIGLLDYTLLKYV